MSNKPKVSGIDDSNEDDHTYLNFPYQKDDKIKIKNNKDLSIISKIKNNDNILATNINIDINKKEMNDKESLYAKPLKKSDRLMKTTTECTTNIPVIHNLMKTNENEIINNDLITPQVTPAALNATTITDTVVASSNINLYPNRDLELEQQRIRNFLKDTTQLHKKMEKNKDFAYSNFSFLAREEHFANLVQQNVIIDKSDFTDDKNNKNDDNNSLQDDKLNFDKLDNSFIVKTDNLNLINNEDGAAAVSSSVASGVESLFRKTSTDATKMTTPVITININREWVLKKIAMCLEQRSFKKPISIPTPSCNNDLENPTDPVGCSFFNNKSPQSMQQQQQPSLPHLGCLILGSNGSGKTTICRNILDGQTGTKGMLNRKLLCCYFINSQNPDCHNLSIFIRNIVLQILSHSSYINNDDKQCNNFDSNDIDLIQFNEKCNSNIDNLNADLTDEKLEKEFNKLENEFSKNRTSTNKKCITRQLSEPSSTSKIIKNDDKNLSYITHPPLGKSTDNKHCDVNDINDSKENKLLTRDSPNKKISKIPVLIGNSNNNNNNKVPKLLNISNEASNMENNIDENKVVNDNETITNINENDMKFTTTIKPLPLPKTKNCKTLIADGYYEMLLNNSDIFDSLSIDNIEKNPDECFKKSILFPLLELNPPKNALLLLIDSIDENYINDGNLITTLRGNYKNVSKSKNIAELLSNHIHLLPKWLLLVCTIKKQNKHITKMFNGFKKITLDDLRKNHVVKDVQEYIITRLNTDFKGHINLNKEIIEILNMLYIKSNGCILYLLKVLNGIKDNFFTLREIKLIPCTLNGLYLYICQKSFNKKQYSKIRPILNILLACNTYVDKLFIYNCLRSHNYTIQIEDFNTRLDLMQNVIIIKNDKIKIFHNSFADWLVDVKFATKKFLCDVNEGHIMISMYYIMISDVLCSNQVRKFIYHLIKTGEYLNQIKNINIDLTLLLLETKANLIDCLYTNMLNCCTLCEYNYLNEINILPKTKVMIEKYLNNQLNDNFTNIMVDFFKPSLPTDIKTLKLLIETGVNNADSQLSYESSINSPECSDKSENIDSELAELLISSEKACNLNNASASNVLYDIGIENNADILIQKLAEGHNIELHKGKALIHVLANEGNHALLDRALRACKHPIDLEIEDLNGQTALNMAARYGQIEVVKLLLDFRQTNSNEEVICVDVNHADRDGWTPLRSASWGGHVEIVKLLIATPLCAIDLPDKEGRTALRAAAWSGHEDILKILIEAGADANTVDRQGRTSLIAASYMGHYEIVDILLENGADVNHLDIDGRSALCVAALCGSSGYNKVISTLLEHGAHTDQIDNDGMSPLLVSAFEGNSEICELLLENGADPDFADYLGRTPLWAACTAGHANTVKLLLFWGCGIDCMDAEGRTVLSIAAAQGNAETVRQLLDRGLDETHRDNAGWTPLHYAAFEGYSEICIQLLEAGAKIDEPDNEGKTALHLAAQEGHNGVIENLLDIHNVCVDQRAHDGKTAFRLACFEGNFESIRTLLKYGCDVNSKDADSRTTLYILALENKLNIVKFLLEFANVDVNIPDSEGRTALHVAAWQGHVDMVKLLITIGNANVNSMDLDSRSPLHSCAWQGNHKVMEILLYHGATPDHSCKQGATALGISAQEGHENCVSILLKYGANPFKSDHCGRTPIKLATKSNRCNVLRILENCTKYDYNLDAKNYQNILKSPDKPNDQLLSINKSGLNITQNTSNLLIPNNLGSTTNTTIGSGTTTTALLNASNSSQNSNFYENTMHSDNSSIQNKRKSVISSHSTGSSNEVPTLFSQLQIQTRYTSSKNQIIQANQRTSTHILMEESYQANIGSNEADTYEIGCMSPLYASPPHSPSSDISSPGQQSNLIHHHFGEIGATANVTSTTTAAQQLVINSDQHFARDTHMRIILGNNKDNQSGKNSKRSGIATNPAVRMIRSRFDSAAQLIRKTNNMLNITSSSNNSNNQGSSSIGVKSGTFQWRKESQM